jgi:hypothetical protein
LQTGSEKSGGTEKITSIAEILGLLDETRRGKDWILQEIKKSGTKIPVKHSMNSFEILKQCPDGFVSHALRVLKGDDFAFEDVKTLTKTYHWFFCDIVAGSNPSISTKDQVRKVIVLNEAVSRSETFKNKDPNLTVILPTGDGMAIGFSDSAEKPLRLAIEIHKQLTKYNEQRKGKEKLLIRVGIDMGPVYFVKDLTGKENVWGPGIILTRRVMDLAADMQILASSRIADDIRKLSPEYKAIMHPIGDYSIKHGEQLYLYNIYGDGFGNKVAPRKSKVGKKNLEKEIKTLNNFNFNNIEIGLEVLDTKTMLVRHTWLWNVVNVSKEPKSQIFYYLDGDTPKEFSDMNVSVTDERQNKMDILAVNVNKPYHKEFNIQLKRPIKPKQKKILKLQYDWEEPERTFFYRFASKCKKFSYHFVTPKGLELKTRVLKVDTETGYKIHASPAPTVKHLADKIEISWTKTGLDAHDAYQFDW